MFPQVLPIGMSSTQEEKDLTKIGENNYRKCHGIRKCNCFDGKNTARGRETNIFEPFLCVQ